MLKLRALLRPVFIRLRVHIEAVSLLKGRLSYIGNGMSHTLACIPNVVLEFLLGGVNYSLVIFKLHTVVGNERQTRLFREIPVESTHSHHNYVYCMHVG